MRPDTSASTDQTDEAADDAAGPARGGTAAARPPHVLFEEIARERPDLPAVVCGDERLTYGELDARADRLAAELAALGVGPEVVVGICLPRRPSLVAAVLAVHKAGGAYLPLDPAHPVERRRFMLEDARAGALVATSALASGLGDDAPPVVNPGDDSSRAHGAPASVEPRRPPGEHDLAYVMYTSGSTGRPKGVMVEHASLAAFAAWARAEFSAEELRSVLLSTSLGFDISVFELLVPLSAGGRVVLVENLLALRTDAVADVTLVNTVPSLVAALLADGALPATARTVVLAGEPLSAGLADRVHAEPGVERLVNAYGPTEDTIYSTFAEVAPGTRPTIGRPLPGSRAYVLDGDLRPVAPGVAGELCLGGAGLARGYLGRPDLTAERFVEVSLPGEEPRRLYRTGDLASLESDGSLAHLGRIDHQIKLRGVRIEPGEIEDALARHPAVRQAAVVARARPLDHEPRLVAYVVAEPGAAEGRALREFLRRTLPETMVPSAFVALDELPLNPNGKLDRSRLPEPSAGAADGSPLTETERRLADLWTGLLGLEHAPGPQDDFFELGGQSLLAFELFERLGRDLGRDLAPNVLVEASTLRSLAARIDGGTAGSRRLVRLNEDGARVPVTYVHAGAGGMFSLRRFSAALGPDQPVFGLQAFADEQIESGDLMSVEETAAECLSVLQSVQPQGPYLLAGHSIGGHIAFEMACRLEAAGDRVSFLGLLDPAAPHTQRRSGRVRARLREVVNAGPEPRRTGLGRVVASAAAARLRGRTAAPGVDAAAPEDDAWLGNLGDVERAYDPPRYRGGAVVYRTAEMGRYTGSDTLGWERYVEGDLVSCRVPGDHVTMLVDPHVQAVARTMREHLHAAQAAAR
ncbi:MAG TPA: amino acid adenylation domain-containing protein [Thermoleophilaceae bacterium]